MRHRDEVLAHQDWYMVGYKESDLKRLKRRTKRRWLKNLDSVREAYEREKETRTEGQRLITDFFPTQEQGEPDRSVDRESPDGREAGNPARSPREEPSPQGDAVS